MRIAKISKGEHRSSSSKISLHWNLQKISADFLFDKSCKYNLGDVDQLDINKLFGLSYGFHHKNSARFGWRSVRKEVIEILAYAYVNGERIFKPICKIPIGERVNFELTNYGHYYEFKVARNNNKPANAVFINKVDHPKWGYKLYPYFGGNKTAPHDMFIYHTDI